MICPSCQTPHAEPAPRFCDGCGLALPRVRPAATATRAAGAGDPAEVRCQECGTPATARRCRGCGARVRWPEDVIPPDEQEGMGRPPAPALDLGSDDAGVDVELDGSTGEER